MRIEKADPYQGKGWYFGPWNSSSSISIGYANIGVDEPHLHQQITEIYLVVRGSSVLQVEQNKVSLQAGDVIAIEPGEAHTFIFSSPDYFHFVIHVPGLQGEIAQSEKQPVPRERLGRIPNQHKSNAGRHL